MRRQRDEIGLRVRESAEAEGRVWAMMWDVSGVKGENVEAGESFNLGLFRRVVVSLDPGLTFR